MRLERAPSDSGRGDPASGESTSQVVKALEDQPP